MITQYKLPFALCTIALYGLLGGFLGPLQASPSFPNTFRDSNGYELRLSNKPQKIVSLTLFSDEILLDLVPPERLAAVSIYAADQNLSNVADKALTVPRRIDFNVEVLLALKPDLILVADWSDAAKVEQARRLGLPVFRLRTPHDFLAISSTIVLLGEMCGENEGARAMVRQLQDGLRSLRQRVANIGIAQRRSMLDFSSFGTAGGRGSTWHSALEAAGISNPVANLAPDQFSQVPVSKELLLSLDPDWLALPAYIFGSNDQGEQFRQSVLNDRALSKTKAITLKQVVVFPERFKTTSSHYLLKSAEFMARTVYPDLF
jgi:iron complex transport system substrate-binding protein